MRTIQAVALLITALTVTGCHFKTPDGRLLDLRRYDSILVEDVQLAPEVSEKRIGPMLKGYIEVAALESKLALGVHLITLISRERADTLATRLRRAGITVTTLLGAGRDGPVNLCFTIVPRRAAPAIAELAREIDPDVVVTIEDVRSSSAKHNARWPTVSALLGLCVPREASVCRTA